MSYPNQRSKMKSNTFGRPSRVAKNHVSTNSKPYSNNFSSANEDFGILSSPWASVWSQFVVGQIAEFTMQDGEIVSGLISAISPACDFAILHSQSSSDLKNHKTNNLLKFADILKVTIKDVDPTECLEAGAFTDEEISRLEAKSMNTADTTNLVPFFDGNDVMDNECDLGGPVENFTPEEMFRKNAEAFNVKSSFDENLGGYTTQIDKNAPDYPQKLQYYTKLAMEMERSGAADDDDAFDAALDNEEEKYSSVYRGPPAPTRGGGGGRSIRGSGVVRNKMNNTIGASGNKPPKSFTTVPQSNGPFIPAEKVNGSSTTTTTTTTRPVLGRPTSTKAETPATTTVEDVPKNNNKESEVELSSSVSNMSLKDSTTTAAVTKPALKFEFDLDAPEFTPGGGSSVCSEPHQQQISQVPTHTHVASSSSNVVTPTQYPTVAPAAPGPQIFYSMLPQNAAAAAASFHQSPGAPTGPAPQNGQPVPVNPSQQMLIGQSPYYNNVTVPASQQPGQMHYSMPVSSYAGFATHNMIQLPLAQNQLMAAQNSKFMNYQTTNRPQQPSMAQMAGHMQQQQQAQQHLPQGAYVTTGQPNVSMASQQQQQQQQQQAAVNRQQQMNQMKPQAVNRQNSMDHQQAAASRAVVQAAQPNIMVMPSAAAAYMQQQGAAAAQQMLGNPNQPAALALAHSFMGPGGQPTALPHFVTPTTGYFGIQAALPFQLTANGAAAFQNQSQNPNPQVAAAHQVMQQQQQQQQQQAAAQAHHHSTGAAQMAYPMYFTGGPGTHAVSNQASYQFANQQPTQQVLQAMQAQQQHSGQVYSAAANGPQAHSGMFAAGTLHGPSVVPGQYMVPPGPGAGGVSNT